MDELPPLVEGLQAEGAVVLVKWDGERKAKRCTVVVSRQDTDYVFRHDSDNISASLRFAIEDYRAKHEQWPQHLGPLWHFLRPNHSLVYPESSRLLVGESQLGYIPRVLPV
jgi:hypothetical protein